MALDCEVASVALTDIHYLMQPRMLYFLNLITP